MTFTAAGSTFQFDTTTFTLTPVKAGDLIMMAVNNNDSATNLVTKVASSNVAWQLLDRAVWQYGSQCQSLWWGPVTSASAQTVTLTWLSGPPVDQRIAGQEFASSTGTWALDQIGYVQHPTGQSYFAPLNPRGPGELYFGYCQDSGNAVDGNTPGYTYLSTNHGNGMAFNPACTAARQEPTWGDNGMEFGIMALILEGSGSSLPVLAAAGVI